MKHWRSDAVVRWRAGSASDAAVGQYVGKPFILPLKPTVDSTDIMQVLGLSPHFSDGLTATPRSEDTARLAEFPIIDDVCRRYS